MKVPSAAISFMISIPILSMYDEAVIIYLHQNHISHFLYVAQHVPGNISVDDQMVDIMPACVLDQGRCFGLGAVCDHHIGSGVRYNGLFCLGILKV